MVGVSVEAEREREGSRKIGEISRINDINIGKEEKQVY